MQGLNSHIYSFFIIAVLLIMSWRYSRVRACEGLGCPIHPYLRFFCVSQYSLILKRKAMENEKLKFRNLTANEIECRVGTVSGTGVSLLLYKDARCDMALLDEVCGPFGWKRAMS